MALKAATTATMLLGECMPCVKESISKFKIKRLELDQNLNMYFPKFEVVFAHDPEKISKTGDVVLIEKLPEKLTRLVTHKVSNVVYPLGDITDPLTGKKVVSDKFRDHVEALNKVYGRKANAFDYSKAPKRGWQEDKKDYTHRETYIKYHDDGTEQPYAV